MTRFAFCGSGSLPSTPREAAPSSPGLISEAKAMPPRPCEVRPRKARRVWEEVKDVIAGKNAAFWARLASEGGSDVSTGGIRHLPKAWKSPFDSRGILKHINAS